MSKPKKKDVLKVRYVLSAPLVLSPPEEGWEVPEALKERIIPSRIEAVLNGDFDKGLSSIADMVIHLWNTSLKRPIPIEYVNIYAYYTNKLLGGILERNGIEIKEITDYEKDLADDLRRRILKKQIKHIDTKTPLNEKEKKILEIIENENMENTVEEELETTTN